MKNTNIKKIVSEDLIICNIGLDQFILYYCIPYSRLGEYKMVSGGTWNHQIAYHLQRNQYDRQKTRLLPDFLVVSLHFLVFFLTICGKYLYEPKKTFE